MRPRKGARGFSLLEILIVVAIIGLIVAIVMPLAGKALRRARAVSAISDMNRTLTQARLNAIRRGFQVVAQCDHVTSTLGGDLGDRIRIRVWEDRNPDFALGTYTPPGGGAPLPEVVLQEFLSEGTFHVWKHGESIDDYDKGVAFNTYGTPADSSLTARIVFLPTGGIVVPQHTASGAPTPTGGRGVYIADRQGRNYFRLTIPSTLVAKVRVEKWIDDTTGYSPNNWVWR